MSEVAVGLVDAAPGFGPYRVGVLLGQGGMGVVHRAYDTVHQRFVALKRLPASVTDRDFRARFRREARIVADLRHPNVIAVNDFGEIDGELFLDMTLVDGTDLRRALATGELGQDRAIDVLTQVADALDAAHAAGLVHRDVKPSNILIDRDGRAYLADFGIASAVSPEATVLTRSEELVGSWDYLAPERLSRGQVAGRADQYSLACVLFECLTGRLPHPAPDAAAKLAAHLLQPPPAPSMFVPAITPALDQVVLRGMAKDPARRFATAGDFMAAARSAAYAGNTVRAAVPTEPVKLRDQVVHAILPSGARRMSHENPPTCPYPGLRCFDSADADWFHGRDRVVNELRTKLTEQMDTGVPVVLIGASGSGKSSVLRAGLLPALAISSAPGFWPRIVLTPGPDPIGRLATALAEHTTIVAADWARVIRETPARFGDLLARAAGGDQVRPVIVVDQFEELVTHDTAETDRLAFVTALANASPVLVVIAIRTDFVEQCTSLFPLLSALDPPVLLEPMDTAELRQAIMAPALDSGVEIEPGLPEQLITDLGHGPDALARLAHALRETWNHSEDGTLTLTAYRQAGGIDGAVARTAEQIYSRLDAPGQRALRTILLRLFKNSAVGLGPDEFAAVSDGHWGVMDQLIAARLVIVDPTGARPAHAALLASWARLRDWMNDDDGGISPVVPSTHLHIAVHCRIRRLSALVVLLLAAANGLLLFGQTTSPIVMSAPAHMRLLTVPVAQSVRSGRGGFAASGVVRRRRGRRARAGRRRRAHRCPSRWATGTAFSRHDRAGRHGARCPSRADDHHPDGLESTQYDGHGHHDGSGRFHSRDPAEMRGVARLWRRCQLDGRSRHAAVPHRGRARGGKTIRGDLGGRRSGQLLGGEERR
ncbi:serine/threonine-protein kinase [Actinocrispum sp. NPDC049592]|uniref:serine/threonine-protein kinase n=1 Tax=Actinocrispum sp. NPDC049592 TaxID=3154835 RepID=UPI00343952B3